VSGPPTLSSVVRGRFVSRVELDNGDFVVVPAGKRKALVSAQSAEAMFRAADVVDGSYRFAVFGLGVVTLSPQVSTPTTAPAATTPTSVAPSSTPGTTTTAAPKGTTSTSTSTSTTKGTTTSTTSPTSPRGVTTTSGATATSEAGSTTTTASPGTTATTAPASSLLPRYDDRLAWVGIAWGAGCPGHPQGTALGTRYVVVVLDAQTGRSALAYTSRSAPACGGPVQPPSVTLPTELVSVPWQAVGPTSTAVRVTIPACATFFGWTDVTGPGTAPIQVVAREPFDPACGSSASIVEVVGNVVPLGKVQAQIPHAVLGPVDVLRTLAGS